MDERIIHKVVNFSAEETKKIGITHGKKNSCTGRSRWHGYYSRCSVESSGVTR